jgi:hypothetical protein
MRACFKNYTCRAILPNDLTKWLQLLLIELFIELKEKKVFTSEVEPWQTETENPVF